MRVQFSPGARASTRGSFIVRGEQIAASHDEWYAAVGPQAKTPDITVMVKKVDFSLLNTNSKLVYDVVDCWRQGADEYCNDGARVKNTADAIELFEPVFTGLNKYVDSYIFPTREMQNKLGHLVPHSTVIYHHYRPGITINPIREKIEVVGYQGAEEFLGEWGDVLDRICDEFGLVFDSRLNDLADADIVVALRGGVHDNWLTTAFKSNIKLANALGSGTPFIGQNAYGYSETGNSSVRYCKDEQGLREELQQMFSWEARSSIQEEFLRSSGEFAIDNIAKQYEAYFGEVACL